MGDPAVLDLERVLRDRLAADIEQVLALRIATPEQIHEEVGRHEDSPWVKYSVHRAIRIADLECALARISALCEDGAVAHNNAELVDPIVAIIAEVMSGAKADGAWINQADVEAPSTWHCQACPRARH